MSGHSDIPRDKIRFGNSELPAAPVAELRLLVVGAFAQGTGTGPRMQRMRVDKDSFNDALTSICPIVSVQVEDGTSSAKLREWQFPVRDLKSFTPAFLAQAPAFADLMQDRKAVEELRDGRISADEFKTRIQSGSSVFHDSLVSLSKGAPAPQPQRPERAAQPPQTPPRSEPNRGAREREDVLESIFGMVEAPVGATLRAEASSEAAVQAFVSSLFPATGRSRAVDRAGADRILRQIDGMLAGRMAEVLASPMFQAVESAWRGLKFLVDRTDFRDRIQLEIIAAPKQSLVSVLQELAHESSSLDAGYDAILADFEFQNSPEDLEILRRAAELAMELRTPIVGSVGPSFFGVATAAEASRISNLRAHLEAAEFVTWDSFRQVESSRWLGIAFNGFLLRGHYQSDTARLAFSFNEAVEGLWGSPVWAIGSLLVRSFSGTHWLGRITGVRGGGLIEDLPLHPFMLPSGEKREIPLETVFLHGAEKDFFEAGFLALQCGEDQDVAVLLDSPSVHRPERYSDARETRWSRQRADLSYQLVTSRIVRFIESRLTESASAGAHEIRSLLSDSLSKLLGPQSNVDIQLTESQEKVGHLDLNIRIRPGPGIWSLDASIEMTIPLRRM